MPLFINYSTGSAPDNGDQFGNIYIAGAALQTTYSYGPTRTTGWYIGIDPPVGGYAWYRYSTGSLHTFSRINSTNDASAAPPDDGINIFPGNTNPTLTQIQVGEDVHSASLAAIRAANRGRITLLQDNGTGGIYTITNAELVTGVPKSHTKLTVTTVSTTGTGYTTGGGGGDIGFSKFEAPDVNIWVPSSDSELLSYYNKMQNTTFSNALEVKDAIEDNDDQFLEGEPIRDGLVMYFDPNNDNSYSGTGTTVYNVAPAATALNITGVLDSDQMYVDPGNNKPAYFRVRSDSVIRRLEFQGSNGADYTVERHGDEDNTLMFFFWSDYQPKDQYSYSQAFFGGKYTNYMALQLHTASSGISYRPEAETNADGGNHDYFAYPSQEGPIFPTGSWGSWTSVFSSSITASNWFNGFPGQGDDGNNNYPLQEADVIHSFRMLGSTSTGTTADDRGGDIRMGVLLMYNRVLTEEEIRFNLNLFEQRYQ